jgi:hypothetical protein
MANTVDKLIEVASNEVGYLEKNSSEYLDDKTKNAGSGNYTKYWRDLDSSMQGEPWCQAFVNWCFMKAYGKANAKKLLLQTAWSYYTPTAAGYFRSAGQWFKTPQKGDIIYFKNSARIHHVGIVKAVEGNTVTTIEGNTSSAVGIVPNGGGVFEKSYQIGNSRIAGYGRPKYEEAVILGWIQSGDKWYYRISENENAHGWQKIRNADGLTRWYHFAADGAMDTGWLKIGNDWYYLEESGDLEGALYRSDANGVQSIWVVE